MIPLTGLLACLACGEGFRGIKASKQKFYYRDITHLEHLGECPQPLVRALEMERVVIGTLQALLAHYLATQEVVQNQEPFALAEARWHRAKLLYLAGELAREVYEREKRVRDELVMHLQSTSRDAIIAVHQVLVLPGESGYDPLNTKKQLRLVLEAAWVQEHALVALQIAPLLLPLKDLGCNSGPDGDCPNFK